MYNGVEDAESIFDHERVGFINNLQSQVQIILLPYGVLLLGT
jgi:hypothetical protein